MNAEDVRKNDRIKLLESLVNKLMNDVKILKAKRSPSRGEAGKDIINEKNNQISNLKKQKSELANELAKVQDQLKGNKNTSELINKCTKLTE